MGRNSFLSEGEGCGKESTGETPGCVGDQRESGSSEAEELGFPMGEKQVLLSCFCCCCCFFFSPHLFLPFV